MQSRDLRDGAIHLCEALERKLWLYVGEPARPGVCQGLLADSPDMWGGEWLEPAVGSGFPFFDAIRVAVATVQLRALEQAREALERQCDGDALALCEAASEYRVLAASLKEHAWDLDELRAAIEARDS
jgi:hypothetical protein